MKTKLTFIVSALCLATIITSCSKSNDPSLEDKMIGNWTGTLIQPVFGELITTFSIKNTTLNGQAGSGSFTSGDISVCDNTQFNCIPLACTFNLTLLKCLKCN
jgi:hypothetical protein